MQDSMSAIIIMGVCGLVLLIGIVRNKAEWFINFVLRAVMGTLAIYFLNQFLVSQNFPLSVGVNPLTVLTSGSLGFPGIAMLYGINLYKFL